MQALLKQLKQPEPELLEVIEPETPAPEVIATEEPSLQLEIDDGTLMLDGQVAAADKLDILVNQARQSLSVDFISNSAQVREDTKSATWLEPITALLPSMAPLNNPGISVEKNQITLSGTAPDQATHDSIINQALQLLGNYALIERINFEEPAPVAPVAAVESTTADATKDNANTKNTEDATQAIEPATTAVADTSAEVRDAIEANQQAVETVAATVANAQTDVNEVVKVDTQAAAIKTLEPNKTADAEAIDNSNASIQSAFEKLPSKQILFKSGSSILTIESLDVLDTIAQLMQEHPNAKMDIDGHTDASGDDQANLLLSQSRANAVRDYLVDQGISVYRLTAFGFGEGMPIASNDSPEGRALNRRIEFKF